VPGEFHAGTSPLIQMLRKGHHGLRLDGEVMDRLVTWIDLNAPCHGTWSEVFPIPDGVHKRRLELRKLYGGPTEDTEADAALKPAVLKTAMLPKASGTDATTQCSSRRPGGSLPIPSVRERTVDLGCGVTMKLVWIPSGFWMSACEVSNEQFRRFDPAHDSRYYAKRHARNDDEGLTLNDSRQPAVRVAWTRAMEFCRWMSERTGLKVTLPTEAQWEHACRAGTTTPLNYGTLDTDFSAWANMGDASFAGKSPVAGIFQMTGGLDHLIVEGAALADARFDDRAIVTAPIGSYKPNAWDLHDMHGNAAEWTLSDDGPSKVVRGGSFFDAPKHCTSTSRASYPSWQRVFNVGFRVICEAPDQIATTK